MGIHGLFKEIAPATIRVSLSKFSADHYATHSRPLVLAIDISIWLFQIQAGRGGSNPALRTFYYRLLRLLTLNIHPLFVFDGPNKPTWKRNKRVGGAMGATGGAGGHVRVATVPEFLAKQLLKHFGFPMHVAPGEAEAECALLQREGIVDAVLSEDVDTLMFGSGILIRNWTAEGATSIPGNASANGGARKKKPTSSKTPTHITMYRAEDIKEKSGMDKEGMVLVALMSGGDYIVEGIPGCGPGPACQAARGGFGKELCALAARKDHAGLKAWRERLQHQFRTNEDKLFTKRKTKMVIPDDFPNLEVLGYYTHPCVSNATALAKLRAGLKWDQPIDFVALRHFAGEAFDWRCLGGAKKFVRNLAPAMLVRELRLRGEQEDIDANIDEREVAEKEMIKAIHGKRNHACTDGELEYRVSYIPLSLVPIDLSIEEDDDQFTAAGETSDAESELALLPASIPVLDEEPASPGKKTRAWKPYHPDQPEKFWMLHTFLQLGCPLMLEDYEASLRDPRGILKARRDARAVTTGKKLVHAKSTGKRTGKKKANDMQDNAMMKFMTVTKAGSTSQNNQKATSLRQEAESDANAERSLSIQGQSNGPQNQGLRIEQSLAQPLSSAGLRMSNRGPIFKLPSTQVPDKLRNFTTSPTSANLQGPIVLEIESDTEPTPRPLRQSHPVRAMSHNTSNEHEPLKAVDSLSSTVGASLTSDINPQHTPRRSKRGALASPSPAMSQRTIDSYWSPPMKNVSRTIVQNLQTERARRSMSITSGAEAEVIDLLSSSPLHVERNLDTANANNQFEVTRINLRELEPNAVQSHTGRDIFADGAEWTLPSGVTPRRRHKRLRRSVEGNGKSKLQRAETAPVMGCDRDFDHRDGFRGSEVIGTRAELLMETRSEADPMLNFDVGISMDLANTPRVLFPAKVAGCLQPEQGDEHLEDEVEDGIGGKLPDLDIVLSREQHFDSTRSKAYEVPTDVSRTSLVNGRRDTTSLHFKRRISRPLLAGAGGQNRDACDVVTSESSGLAKQTSGSKTYVTTNAGTFSYSKEAKTLSRPSEISDIGSTTAQPGSSTVLKYPAGSIQETSKSKKLYLPRDSLPGFFKEVEVDAVDLSGDGSGWKSSGKKAQIFNSTATICVTGRTGTGAFATSKRGFRKSTVEVLDLTGA